MTDQQKECIREIQDLVMAINETVKKYDLEDEFLACIAVGFLNMNTLYKDEEGKERADMSLLSSFSVEDEDELDDLLSFCLDSYRIDKKEVEEDVSFIDYWINLSRRDGDVN